MADLLPDQLRLMAEHHPDEIGFTNVATDASLTFDEWERRSNRLARWLVAHGVNKGDRVAVLVPPEEPDRFLVAYAAVHKSGAAAVPTSTRLVARELAFVLGHAGAVVPALGDHLDRSVHQPLVIGVFGVTRHRRDHNDHYPLAARAL